MTSRMNLALASETNAVSLYCDVQLVKQEFCYRYCRDRMKKQILLLLLDLFSLPTSILRLCSSHFLRIRPTKRPGNCALLLFPRVPLNLYFMMGFVSESLNRIGQYEWCRLN
jgi:hypothetical protein